MLRGAEPMLRNPKSTATAAYMGLPTGLWRLEVSAKSIRAACVELSWRLVNMALFSTGATHANFVVHGGFSAPSPKLHAAVHVYLQC